MNQQVACLLSLSGASKTGRSDVINQNELDDCKQFKRFPFFQLPVFPHLSFMAQRTMSSGPQDRTTEAAKDVFTEELFGTRLRHWSAVRAILVGLFLYFLFWQFSRRFIMIGNLPNVIYVIPMFLHQGFHHRSPRPPPPPPPPPPAPPATPAASE